MWLMSNYCTTSCYNISKNFGPNWAHIAPKDFFGEITNATFAYLFCLIMTKNFKNFLREWIMRHNVGYFWPKLAINCPFLKKEFSSVNWLGEKLLWSNYGTPLYHISKFKESESCDIIAWELRLHNFGPNWAQNAQLY